jgi:hypothetical protein
MSIIRKKRCFRQGTIPRNTRESKATTTSLENRCFRQGTNPRNTRESKATTSLENPRQTSPLEDDASSEQQTLEIRESRATTSLLKNDASGKERAVGTGESTAATSRLERKHHASSKEQTLETRESTATTTSVCGAETWMTPRKNRKGENLANPTIALPCEREHRQQDLTEDCCSLFCDKGTESRRRRRSKRERDGCSG